jgi:hypothetical protein
MKELPTDQVCKILDISRTNLFVLVYRARNRLRECLEEKESLDWFIGSWTEQRAREFEESAGDFERIDEELWK